MRHIFLLPCSLLLACQTTEEPPTIDWCDGTIGQAYDLTDDGPLYQWPDDRYLQADASSPTGRRVHVPPDTPWFVGLPSIARGLLDVINAPSGFARLGGIVLTFTEDIGPLPDPESSATASELQLLDLGGPDPIRVPYRVVAPDHTQQVVVEPLGTLRGGTLHALVLTAEHAAPGGCVRPSPALRALLTGELEAEQPELSAAWAEVLAKTGLAADEISAGTVFTTHDDLSVLRDAAGVIDATEHVWSEPVQCDGTRGSHRACAGRFIASDFRTDGIVRSAEPQDTWELEVDLFLPEGPGPHPVMVFAHGMSGDRGEVSFAVDRWGDLGFAVIGIDALEHGDHPTAVSPNLAGAAFLGIDLESFTITGAGMRGSFEQSVLDGVSLIDLIVDSPDVDGDGVADLDPERIVYMGVSLGGMLGSGVLALSDDLDAGLLFVAGGHLARFATDTEVGALFAGLFREQLGNAADLDRVLALAQTAADPADPATFGAHLLHDRLRGDTPSLLLPVSMNDAVVPPTAGFALARGAGVPHLPSVLQPMLTLPLEESLPVSGNIDGGAATAGYLQLDTLEGETTDHNNLPRLDGIVDQATHFLETWLDSGVPEIVSPGAP